MAQTQEIEYCECGCDSMVECDACYNWGCDICAP